MVWVIVNSGYVLIGVQLMHHRLLPDEKRNWYIRDVGQPLSIVVLIAIMARWIIADSAPTIGLLVYRFTVLAAMFLVQCLRRRNSRPNFFQAIS